MKRKTWIALGAGIVVLGAGAAYLLTRGSEEVKFRTAKVEKGTVRQRISATGTLSAVVQVNVGAQVTGILTALHVDYNSLVEKGQVIAQIDPTTWEQRVKDAEATLQRSEANFNDAKTQLARYERLAKANLVSDQELDTRRVTFQTAKAQLDSARIGLERAQADLGYCSIKAPVSGVVVGRSVDVGQTVTSGFSTPNLFVIAQDLSKMKLEVSIDEADIGKVKVGQDATFTVDSYPDRRFFGKVAQVRLEPIVQQNVVTYKVVMEVNNQPIDPAAAPAPESKGPAQAPRKPEERPARRPEGHGGGEGGGFRAMDPAAREALLKKMGYTPEDFQDPAKREAIRAKFREMREKMGGAPPAAMAVSAGAKAGGKREPGGINFAGGPVYQGNLALRPGMTANVTIGTDQRDDVLKVPSAALRFNAETFLPAKKEAASKTNPPGTPAPPANAGAPAGRPQGGMGMGMGMGGGRGMAPRADRIWVMGSDKQPKALTVKAGISDGQFTEISGDTLAEGMEVLVGVQDTKNTNAANRPQPLTGGGAPGMRR